MQERSSRSDGVARQRRKPSAGRLSEVVTAEDILAALRCADRSGQQRIGKYGTFAQLGLDFQESVVLRDSLTAAG